MNVAALGKKLGNNIKKALLGKDNEIALVLTALLAGGHVLLEDVPGTGKTTLANAIAKSIALECKRIQFTPDLLPGDIVGVDFFNMKTQEFRFHSGPVFCNVLIADEINRATPRTQSALLECMQERQVTVGGNTYKLPEPFFVIATENPIETAGTFPLPEAQTDRFSMKLSLGYSEAQDEVMMLETYRTGTPLLDLAPVCSAGDIAAAQSQIAKLTVSSAVEKYIVDICRATRSSEKIRLGVSPRGALTLMRLSQSYAALCERDFVLPDDVKHMALPCFSHRIISNSQRSLRMSDSNEAVIKYILDTVRAPIE